MRIAKKNKIVKNYIECLKLLENAKNGDKIDVNYCKKCLKRLKKRKKELKVYL